MGFGVIIFTTITLIVVFFVIAHFVTKKSEEYRQENIERMSLAGFTKTKEFRGLVIDQEHKKWAVVLNGKQQPYIHDFSSLVDFKLVENGVEYKSSGGITRAIVGGALFGVAGAIVGASTSKSKQGVASMYITMVTNDFNRPTEKIVLWNQTSSPAKGVVYSNLIKQAEEIMGLLTAIQANA